MDNLQKVRDYCSGVIIAGISAQAAVARDVLGLLDGEVADGPLSEGERVLLDALLDRYRKHGIPSPSLS